MNSNLNQLIRNAQIREGNDDHLSNEERQEIVNIYSQENPEFISSNDLDQDFVNIIF